MPPIKSNTVALDIFNKDFGGSNRFNKAFLLPGVCQKIHAKNLSSEDFLGVKFDLRNAWKGESGYITLASAAYGDMAGREHA